VQSFTSKGGHLSSLDYQRLKTARRIGLFDSGVGGLTVLDKLKNLSLIPASPEADCDNGRATTQARQFVYLGDTARCPYGNRPPKEIITFVTEIIDWLSTKQVDAIVVACNTSASLALPTARLRSSVPIYDLITPTAEHLASLGAKVGVMATASTAASRAFSRSICAICPDLEVVEIACPDLVPIVEKGEVSSSSTLACLRKYADQLLKEKVEALVFGCTHFPFLQEPLARLLSNDMLFVDPAKILFDLLDEPMAGSLAEEETQQESQQESSANSAIYVTGDKGEFSRVARICLGYSPGTVYGISVEELTNSSVPDKVSHDSKTSPENIPAIPAIQMGT
jgi:glutamate racemase